ncbi:MAG TPA: hypothetical protein VFO91_10020 [Anaerolineales bacterium]|nr:hypothetical protein [Anaerolineales bacterium]
MDSPRRLFTIILLLAVTACASDAQTAPTATLEILLSPTAPPQPTEQPTGTPEPSPTPVLESPLSLVRVGDQVHAYPGPRHYAGDVLTFEVPVEGFREPPEVEVSLTLDGANTTQVGGQWSFNRLIIPLALDTSGLAGSHEVRIQAPGEPSVDAVYAFEVLPADQRPRQEIGAEWETIQIPCCTLHYITNTAAARDLETIAEHAGQAADDFAGVTGVEVQNQLDVYIMDRMWLNGAFAGGDELLMAYTDRYYGPSQGGTGLETVFKHEFTHATGTDRAEEGFFPFNEGLAVYIAGGHYKPEPIPARGAAMLELGYEAGLDPFASQHEIAYLHGATIMAYIAEEYGWEALMEFGQNAAGDRFFSLEDRDQIMQAVFGVPSDTFEADYLAWLRSHEPGAQLDDLRLTVALQDLRREYQRQYAPEPFSIFGRSDETYARPEYLPVLIREANALPNVAVELMIADAQKAIVAGEYDSAERLIEAIEAVVNSGEFKSPLAYDYASITLTLGESGYEGLSLDLQGDQATAQVTRAAPSMEEVTLQRVDGEWRIMTGQ